MRAALASLNIILPPEQIAEIQRLTAPTLIFPHAMLRLSAVRSIVTGGMAEQLDNQHL
jgi:hypothetical protein